ncbi:MAG: zinc ribbon domain-containing protein [Deltaproteobacteria bacterium]|nr:zinc ribbon domain-containing protein [Candidatus Tharpella aukensis]
MYCTQCGEKNSEDANFCSKCGAIISNINPCNDIKSKIAQGERVACLDLACTGIIGIDGTCGTCGKSGDLDEYEQELVNQQKTNDEGYEKLEKKEKKTQLIRNVVLGGCPRIGFFQHHILATAVQFA